MLARTLLVALILQAAWTTDLLAEPAKSDDIVKRVTVQRNYLPLVYVFMAVGAVWGLLLLVERGRADWRESAIRNRSLADELASAHELSEDDQRSLQELARQTGVRQIESLYVSPQLWNGYLQQAPFGALFDRLFGEDARTAVEQPHAT